LTRHLGEFVDLLRSTLPSSLDFQLEFEPDVPAVLVDPTQLDQVLMNLCINARDAMEGQGAMRVTVRRRQCRDGICASCQVAVAGDFVELAVADTGQGIAPAVLERVFDPFFTTKPQGKGTGMGLSTTHGIVHDGGGHILVESTVGKGSTFRVLLPVLDAATGVKVRSIPAPSGPLGLALTPGGKVALVACFISNHLYAIETAQWRVWWKMEVGSCHVGVCVTPDGREALVTNSDQDHLSVIDLVGRKENGRIQVGPNPAYVQLLPGGRQAYVTNRGADSVSLVDLATRREVRRIPVGASPLGMCVG